MGRVIFQALLLSPWQRAPTFLQGCQHKPMRHYEYQYLTRHHTNIPSPKQSHVSHTSVEPPKDPALYPWNYSLWLILLLWCVCLPLAFLHYLLVEDYPHHWFPGALAECWWPLPEHHRGTRLLLTAVFSYLLDGLVHAKGWTLKLVVLHFPLVAPGACTTMVVSLPEARFQESLSWWGMTQKRLVSISEMSFICKEIFSVAL